MVETITPVVHGGRGRWLGAVGLHALGAVATAGGFGAALGWLGARLGAPWGRAGMLAVAASALAYAFTRAPVPQLRRQVPEWWRTFFGRPVAAFLYGAGLGIGFLTYLERGTFVAVTVAAVAMGRPAAGALLVAPFGVVRGLSVLVSWRSATPDAGRRLVDRLAAASPRARAAANALALTATAALALLAAVHAEVGGWWRLGAAALAAAFGWAGLAKLGPRWPAVLEAHRLPRWASRRARWAVPAAELLVPTAILLGYPRWGAGWALALLTAFTLELLRVGRVRPVPCGCFGGRTETTIRTSLARNGALAAAGILVAAAGRAEPTAVWPGAPSSADVLPMLLAATGLGLCAATARAGARWLAHGRRA